VIFFLYAAGDEEFAKVFLLICTPVIYMLYLYIMAPLLSSNYVS
jgi:hypothetical protein